MTRPMDLAEYIPDRPWPRVPEGTELVRLDESHSEAANRLFNKVFGQERTLDHFRWKFWENPAGPPVGFLCAFREDGRPLAMNIGQRKQVRVGGRDVEAILICESASDPEARLGGRPYYAATSAVGVQAGREGIPFAFGGQSTDEAIKVGRRWFGYRVIFALQVWMQRLSLKGALRSRLGRVGETLGGAADLVVRGRSRPRGGDGLTLEEREDFGPEFDVLWERYRDRYEVVLRRDAATLRWRYRDCPIGPNRVLLACRGGEPAGYVVWREWTEGRARVATVLDLWDGRSEDLARVLLQGAGQEAGRAGCEFLLYAAMPGSAGEAAVQRLQGFRPSEHHPPDRVICTPLPIPEERVREEDYEVMRRVILGANWYYTQGDCDFRD